MEGKTKHKWERCAFFLSMVLTLVFSMISLIQKSLSLSSHSSFRVYFLLRAPYFAFPTAERSLWFTAVSGTTQKAIFFSFFLVFLGCATCRIGKSGFLSQSSAPDTPELSPQGHPKRLSPILFEYLIIPRN